MMNNGDMMAMVMVTTGRSERSYAGGCEAKPEKAVAPHSSTLAWKIPWTEEPGGLQSMRSRRLGHN